MSLCTDYYFGVARCYVQSLTNPASLNCHSYTSVVFGHWNEHVVVVGKILVGCVLQTHVG